MKEVQLRLDKLKSRRLQTGIAASVLAELLGCTEGTYYKKETGKLGFSLVEAKKVAEYFGETIEAIYF